MNVLTRWSVATNLTVGLYNFATSFVTVAHQPKWSLFVAWWSGLGIMWAIATLLWRRETR